jgi:AcrR family transcriptional regulator
MVSTTKQGIRATEAVRSRREEYAEATHEALVDSASACFFESGFAATSLDHVAQRARVTKGAIYHHFTSKRELFLAVLERQQEHSVGSVTLAGASAARCLDRDRGRLRCVPRHHLRPGLPAAVLGGGPGGPGRGAQENS